MAFRGTRFLSQQSTFNSLKPLFDRVLVEKAQPVKKVGNVLLPESAAEKLNWGTVIEVGSGKRLADGKFTPLAVKKGDKVMLGEWSGNTVKFNNKELFVVKEEEILGILE